MYTLLIADDERAIREGIYKAVRWKDIGIDKVLLAQNGKEAYEYIVKERPDIVLTDIIMPVFTGIELIEKAREIIPRAQFIILSGYNDFCYAQKAIQNEVKQYLLKPCNAADIKKIIQTAVSRLRTQEEEERLVLSMKENMEKLLPQAKEQFFRDFIQGQPYNHPLGDYKKLFHVDDIPYRMLLFRSGEQDYMKLLTLKNLIEQNFGSSHASFCIIMNASVILLTSITDFNTLSRHVTMIQQQCSKVFQFETTVAVSDEGYFDNAPLLYREVKDIIPFEFYLGEGRVITKADMEILKTDYTAHIDFRTEELSRAIRSGNIDLVTTLLDTLFNSFSMHGYDIRKVRAAAIEVYIVVIRQCADCEISTWIQNITKINECVSVPAIKQYILDTAIKLAKIRYDLVISNQNRLIEKVIRYVQENMDDEELSLQLIASKILYLNVDYLGKLFKKETGMRFSQYLLQVRMEKAKELIKASSSDIKIYEIAKATGFANNPSYFTQIFKKYTGCVPTEFRQVE